MRRSLLPRLCLTLLLLSGISAATALAAVPDRIAAAISGNSRAAIPNSVHGKIRLATDLGPTSGDTRLQDMSLRFSMTATQQAALDQLLQDQQNPSSPRYHQWLTPGQFAAQFGLSGGDLAKASAWLASQGFTITEVASSGTFIRFKGTVAQAESAFSTSIRNLSLNGETHFANTTDVSLPNGLAGVVMGVTGLHDFKLKSRVRTATVQSPLPQPNFTSSLTGSHYIAPGDFYTIYDVNPLIAAGTNGAGVTIAIMGQVDIKLTDIAAFRTASGLAANLPKIITYVSDPGPPVCSQNCTPNSGDLAESSLDVEWAGAIAPSANIIFVNSPNVITDSLTDAIDNNIAPIVSISYGDCEPNWGTTELNVLNSLLAQANAQGITVTAPGGDTGATDCDASDTSAIHGLAVDFPASSPNATGLGGTMFNEGSATGATTYWSANSSSTTNNAGSALSYIPEAVWNEDTAGSQFSSGGGGVSAFFPRPSWQVGTGVPTGTFRTVPDLALNSAASHDGYLYCVSNSCTNGGFRASDGQSLTEAGGTSFAAPTFAGILALVEQKLGSRIGNANPTIYALANGSQYSSIFHDITTGNNDSPCVAGAAFTSTSPFTPTPATCPSTSTIGYSAGTGYDLATGWGSVDANNLASRWTAVTPPVAIQSSTADFTLTPATTTATVASASQTATATFSVAPLNGFTGNVTFSATFAATTGVTPTFSFSPASVTTSGTTTLTITFPSASLTMPSNGIPSSAQPVLAERRAPWLVGGSGAAMACLFLMVLPRRRRLGTLLIAVLAIVMAAGATGCGSANSTISSPISSNPRTGSYTVIVTATSPAQGTQPTSTHSASVNVTVQ